MDFLNLLISKHLLRFMCISSRVNSARNIYDKLSLYQKVFNWGVSTRSIILKLSDSKRNFVNMTEKKKFHSRKIKFLNDWVSKLKVRPSGRRGLPRAEYQTLQQSNLLCVHIVKETPHSFHDWSYQQRAFHDTCD